MSRMITQKSPSYTMLRIWPGMTRVCVGWQQQELQPLQRLLPVRSGSILRGSLHSLGNSIHSRLSSNVGVGGSQR